jgi:hypothetical protein
MSSSDPRTCSAVTASRRRRSGIAALHSSSPGSPSWRTPSFFFSELEFVSKGSVKSTALEADAGCDIRVVSEPIDDCLLLSSPSMDAVHIEDHLEGTGVLDARREAGRLFVCGEISGDSQRGDDSMGQDSGFSRRLGTSCSCSRALLLS